jgi:hypothetical protein
LLSFQGVHADELKVPFLLGFFYTISFSVSEGHEVIFVLGHLVAARFNISKTISLTSLKDGDCAFINSCFEQFFFAGYGYSLYLNWPWGLAVSGADRSTMNLLLV